MKNNIEFVCYLLSLLEKNTVYMWDENGREVTDDIINEKASMWPSYYSLDKMDYLYSLVGKNYYAFDCSGLIKSYWMSDFGIKDVVYNSKIDKNSYEITLESASLMGDIDNLPEIPGLFLYMKGHCAVYLGDNKVIECTSNEKISGKKYGGVCITNLNDRSWEKWVKSSWLIYLEK